jgi:hypothetical protein
MPLERARYAIHLIVDIAPNADIAKVIAIRLVPCKPDKFPVAHLAEQRDIALTYRAAKVPLACEPFGIGKEIRGRDIVVDRLAENDATFFVLLISSSESG